MEKEKYLFNVYAKVINIFLVQREIRLRLTFAGAYTHIAINQVIYHTTTKIKFCKHVCARLYTLKISFGFGNGEFFG
ncbi:MAG TPA: hypothetical protein VF700_02815 [Segetibacter sp.]